jgi:hypothetical protein
MSHDQLSAMSDIEKWLTWLLSSRHVKRSGNQITPLHNPAYYEQYKAPNKMLPSYTLRTELGCN